jgi:hypothetical protein
MINIQVMSNACAGANLSRAVSVVNSIRRVEGGSSSRSSMGLSG